MGEHDNGVLVFIQATLLHGSSCLFVPKNILREKNDNDAQERREVGVGVGKKHGNITKDKIHK